MQESWVQFPVQPKDFLSPILHLFQEVANSSDDWWSGVMVMIKEEPGLITFVCVSISLDQYENLPLSIQF